MKTSIAVLGAGTMGQGIAQLAAQHQHTVHVYDPNEHALQTARHTHQRIFNMLEQKQRLNISAQTAMNNLHYHSSLSVLQGAGVELVIEAAPERWEVKRALFEEVGRLLPDVLLATNTSTLSVTRLAGVTFKPERVVGMHFFNPAPLMKLVEVIAGLRTSASAVAQATQFVASLGKQAVQAADTPGFIVNRVARAFYSEALVLSEQLDVALIDALMRRAGFRMGPFELMDLIGIDVNYAAASSVYEQFFHERRFKPHPKQRLMVEAGLLGKKTNQGFYSYPRNAPPEPPERTPASTRKITRVYIQGNNPITSYLKRHLHALTFVTNPSDAQLIIDTRVSLEEKPFVTPDVPVLSLCFAHDASHVARCYAGARSVTGFCVLPTSSTPQFEVFAPVTQHVPADVLAFCAAHALNPRVVPADVAGGVSFRIIALLINEACSAVADGTATPDAINSAMRLGVNYPLGPLEWSEALGLGVVLEALRGLHGLLGERFRPQPLLAQMVAAGVTGWAALGGEV